MDSRRYNREEHTKERKPEISQAARINSGNGFGNAPPEDKPDQKHTCRGEQTHLDGYSKSKNTLNKGDQCDYTGKEDVKLSVKAHHTLPGFHFADCWGGRRDLNPRLSVPQAEIQNAGRVL